MRRYEEHYVVEKTDDWQADEGLVGIEARGMGRLAVKVGPGQRRPLVGEAIRIVITDEPIRGRVAETWVGGRRYT